MINLDDRLLDEVNEKELWLICHLARRMRTKEQVCFPSNGQICTDTGWTENTVQAWKKSLLEKGILVVRKAPGKPNFYEFTTDLVGIYLTLKGDGFSIKNDDNATKSDTQTDPKDTAKTPETLPKNWGYPKIGDTQKLGRGGTQKLGRVWGVRGDIISLFIKKYIKKELSPEPNVFFQNFFSENFGNCEPAKTAWIRWVEYREEKKKPINTVETLKKNLDDLKKFSGGRGEVVEQIIGQSIGRSWTGLFPLDQKAPLAAAPEPTAATYSEKQVF